MDLMDLGYEYFCLLDSVGSGCGPIVSSFEEESESSSPIKS